MQVQWALVALNCETLVASIQTRYTTVYQQYVGESAVVRPVVGLIKTAINWFDNSTR